jgi:hypothetical protein
MHRSVPQSLAILLVIADLAAEEGTDVASAAARPLLQLRSLVPPNISLAEDQSKFDAEVEYAERMAAKGRLTSAVAAVLSALKLLYGDEFAFHDQLSLIHRHSHEDDEFEKERDDDDGEDGYDDLDDLKNELEGESGQKPKRKPHLPDE